MYDRHRTLGLENVDQRPQFERRDSAQPLATPSTTVSGLPVISPHLLETVSSAKGHSSTVSTTSSHIVSSGSGAAALSSATSSATGAMAGSVGAIVFIVVLILSIISCVAGCIWKCCIKKGRKEQVAQANQQTTQEYPRHVPQVHPQQYGYQSNTLKEQIYGRAPNEAAVYGIDMDSNMRPGQLNGARRFETIPEHDDSHEGYAEHESVEMSNVPRSNVSPRKGYFYYQDRTGERS